MSVDTAEVDVGVNSEQLDAFAQPEGGAESTGDSAATGAKSAAAEEFADLPEDFMKNVLESDPEMKALVEGKAPDGDKGSEDHDAEGASGEDSAAGEQKQEAKADDTSGEDDAPFVDDVIPGLKGEVFGKLPEEAQEAVAKFYQESQEKTAKAEAITATMEKLQQDPYLKARIAAAEAGVQVPVRGITPEEEKSIGAVLIEKLGLDPATEGEALAEAIAALKPGLDAVAKSMAQDYAAQTVQVQESIKQTNEVNRQGNEILLGLSQFDKNLAVKETDISKFYAVQNGKAVFNEKHPEIEKYKNGVGKFVQWAYDHGIDNRQIVKMGAKAFYAAAAVDLGKTVAFNSTDRDKKIAAEARRSAINLFRKAGSGTLATQGSAPKGKAGTYIENGVDAVRLATDGAYFDELVSKKPGDLAWIDKLSELEAKGREILNRKQKG